MFFYLAALAILVTFGQAALATMETACLLYCMKCIKSRKEKKTAIQAQEPQHSVFGMKGVCCRRKNNVVTGTCDAEEKKNKIASKDAEAEAEKEEQHRSSKQKVVPKISEIIHFVDRCMFVVHSVVSLVTFSRLIFFWVEGKANHYRFNP